MLKSFTFNGIKKSWVVMGLGREKAPFAPIHRNLINVNNMDGSYLSSTNTNPLIIRQSIHFKTHNDEQSLQLKDELARWLFTEKPAPLEFDDEPGRVYYAVVNNTLDDFEYIANYRRGTIEFLVLDGYGYGQEKTIHFPSDQVVVNNNGTAPADPIFELTATKKSTFAMIGNQDDEYMMLGQPADDDVQEVDYRTSVMYENGGTLNEWRDAGFDMVDDNFIDSLDGTMVGDAGVGIRMDNYGTPRKERRGAAKTKELDESIQDFEIETTFDIISRREEENWRMDVYFHDENMNMIGKLGMIDNTRHYRRRRGQGRVGEWRGGDLRNGYIIGEHNHSFDNVPETTLMYLRAKREGKKFTFYIARWLSQRHVDVVTDTFIDVNNDFQGRLKYITVFIGSYQDRPTPWRLRINNVEVFELKTVEEDQTPYIVYPNDVITFDHVNEDILLNGQVRPDLFTSIGADFFKLKEGYNQIGVLPENSFETNVKFRERFR